MCISVIVVKTITHGQWRASGTSTSTDAWTSTMGVECMSMLERYRKELNYTADLERQAVMPRFGVLISRDENMWWSYTLIIDHKIVKVATPFETPEAALRAGLYEANLRGHYNG